MYSDIIKAELDYIFGGLSPYEEMELDDILYGEYDDDPAADLVTVKDWIDAEGHYRPIWLSYTNDNIISDRYDIAADVPQCELEKVVISADYDAQGELNLLINAEV